MAFFRTLTIYPAVPPSIFGRSILAAALIAIVSLPLAPALAQNDYPEVPQAREGAPNIVLIMTDDTGFGVASAFGGPIPTPHLERLAARGLSYTRFHTTAMCSPTRAALLTGRNHHAVATGTLTDFANGHAGYNAFLPDSAATIARVLRDNGYSTAMFGKHHNIPIGQLSASGPFDHWPTGLGFEYFFGTLQSDTDQWNPMLFRGTSRLDDAHSGDLLDQRLADDAINWIHNQKAAAPEKPFLVYFSTGSSHTPHQAPAEWVERFRGQFSEGWNVLRQQTLDRQIAMGIVPADTELAPWPADVPLWEDRTPDERRVDERYMEAFAAMVAYQDEQIGRLIDEIERMGLSDNTLIVFIEGDNGADGAGSPDGSTNEVGEIANQVTTLEQRLATLEWVGTEHLQTNYATGWALAMSTPFPFYKQMASHLGGTRNGMVISWPERIGRSGIRSQYHHVIDVAPTIFEAAGVEVPSVVDGVAQQPIDGASMAYTFPDPEAEDRRTTQYYEMLGNRGIYHEGWLANTTPRRHPWHMSVSNPETLRNQAADYEWELYDLRSDFSQSNNLAAREPGKLAEMIALFESEAERYNVNPIDDRTTPNRWGPTYARYLKQYDRYTYWGKDISISLEAAPNLPGQSFVIEAELANLPEAESGVVAAVGSRFGGWSFFLDRGRPAVAHALTPIPGDWFDLTAPTAIPPGAATLRFAFIADHEAMGAGGLVQISVNGQVVAEKRIERTILRPAGVGETFDIGLDRGVTVTDRLSGAGILGAEVSRVTVNLGTAASTVLID